MGIGLVLMAIGALLTWGVHLDNSGVDINALGAIVLGMGVGRVALSAGFWNISSGSRFALEQVSTHRDVDGRQTA